MITQQPATAGADLAAGQASPTGQREYRAGLRSLLLQPVALRLPAWPGPRSSGPLPADSVPTPRPWRQRWKMQVLAGPALTYRRLGEVPPMAGRVPVVPTFTRAEVGQLERSALGFGAQLQLRRRLGRRWALSTGVGYAEYAVNLSLRVTPYRSSITPDSLASFAVVAGETVQHRDTYRFLAIPAHFTYQLSNRAGRLRPALLAGADLQYFLGGSTLLDGNVSTSQPKAGTDGGTAIYRPLSLSLQLGLELRYRLAPRWELLAQPAATYFLTSIVRASDAAPVRHPLGLGLQAGVSFDLP